VDITLLCIFYHFPSVLVHVIWVIGRASGPQKTCATSRGSVLGQMEEKEQRKNQLTQIQLENGHQN